ncbi:MAG: hypothetical protein RDV48_27985 [Candidatus Eremiobacteraeota bacterium]|nr:hypothetical protein [Candidatus Eremiobacteraeota bacterium]
MEHRKHRTQISLEDWQYMLLRELSMVRKQSISSLIRDLIAEKYLDRQVALHDDPLMGIIGMATGDGDATARSHDDVLYGDRQ